MKKKTSNIEIYDNDSKYFEGKKERNVDKSFFLQTDYNTGTEYRVPLKEIINNEYMSDPNLQYITQDDMRFDYNYLYYIKEKFGQYDIQNIVNFQDQKYCPATIMNYRTFEPVPMITEDQRRNSPYGYCSHPIIFWAPLSNIFNKYPNIEQGRYWISTTGKVYDIKSDRYSCIYKEFTRQENYYHSYMGFGYNYHECVLSCINYSYYSWTHTWDCPVKKHAETIMCRIDELMLYTFAYFPGCEQYQVYHKNGNSCDDRIENLEWLTQEEINNIYNNVKS